MRNQIPVYFLIFTFVFSSFSFTVRAQQDSSINPDKVKALSELPQETVRDETFFAANSDNLVPSAVITVNPNVAIPDDGYTGAGGTGGMTCATLNTTQFVPAGTVVANVSISAAMTHTWIGDLTMKLRAPNGQLLTILNRPGSTAPDNGTDTPIGDNSNWSGATITFADGGGPEAETMGGSLTDAQSVCTNDGVCSYDPSPDTAPVPPAGFADLRDQNARGEWALCVGDSAALDAGTLNSWTLNLIYAYQVSTTPNAAIPDDAYTGGFGVAGQTCSTINTAGINTGSPTVVGVYVNVDMAHTWVGDLTMKLRSPDGTTLTFLNRPGSNAPDDGTGAVGNSANWSGFLQFRDGAGPEAETPGGGLSTDQLVCPVGSLCRFDPSPDTAAQPPAAFSAFNGGAVAGNWTLCVGDSALGDVGTLRSWRLNLVSPSALVPTAASVTVAGQISSAYGMSVRNAVVNLMNSDGTARTARTNPFGFYRFEGVPVGETYTVGVQAKGYTFAPRVVFLSDELSDLNFTAEP